MRPGLEVTESYGYGNAVSFDAVGTHPGRDAVCQGQEHLVRLFCGDHIFLCCIPWSPQGQPGREVIDTVGIVVDLLAHFDTNELLHPIQGCIGKVTDRLDRGLFQLLSSGCINREQVLDGKGPHLLRNIMTVQSIYLVTDLQ